MLPGSVVTKIFENLVEECTFFSWMSTVLRLWLREGGVFSKNFFYIFSVFVQNLELGIKIVQVSEKHLEN